jgi:hypothetical protein
MTEKLAPEDDPRVIEYRRIIAAADDLDRLTDSSQQYDAASHLVRRYTDLTRDNGAGRAYRIHANAELTPERSSAQANLFAFARLSDDFASAVFGNCWGKAMTLELLAAATGEDMPLASQIPRSKRRGGLTILTDAVETRTIYLAHYRAALNKTGWEREHRDLCDAARIGISDCSRELWNTRTDPQMRKVCRAAGAARRTAPDGVLEPSLADAERQATSLTPKELKNGLRVFKRGRLPA